MRWYNVPQGSCRHGLRPSNRNCLKVGRKTLVRLAPVGVAKSGKSDLPEPQYRGVLATPSSRRRPRPNLVVGQSGNLLGSTVLLSSCRLSLFRCRHHLASDILSGPDYRLAERGQREDAVYRAASWGHGAFTKILLDALAGGASARGRGPISVGELTAYLQKKLPELTTGSRHLGVNPDFQRVMMNIFVTGN